MGSRDPVLLHGGLDDKCASKKSEEKLNRLVFGCSKQVMAYPQVEAAKREEDKVEVRWNSEDKSTSKSYQINFKIDKTMRSSTYMALQSQ